MSSKEKVNGTITNGISLAQILSKDGEPIEEAVEMADGPELEENEEGTQVAKEGYCVECEGKGIHEIFTFLRLSSSRRPTCRD